MLQKFKDASKNTQTLIVVGAVLFILIILGVVIYFWAKSKGKAEGTINITAPPTDNPTGNTSVSSSEAEIQSVASELYQDMKGAAWGHEIAPWKRWLQMSDTDFVRVYNQFNTDHQVESQETMKQWVEGEQGWTQLDWTELKNTALTRMAKLNLK